MNTYLSKFFSLKATDRGGFPLYIMRLGSGRQANDVRFVFSKNDLYNDIYKCWGDYDFAVQVYMLPKTMKPCIVRYRIKNCMYLKSACVSNHKFFLDLIDQIERKRGEPEPENRASLASAKSEGRHFVLLVVFSIPLSPAEDPIGEKVL